MEDKKKELKEKKYGYFVFVGLTLTALLGLVCGIGMLFPNQIFGYYLFFIVSGMMIYSYINYAGVTYDNKNWFMFVLCITVIVFTIVLASLLIYYMASGIID